MKKIINKIFLIGFLILLTSIFRNNVYAASASISASATNVEPNTKVIITANVKDVESWNLSISTDGGTLTGDTSSTDAGDGNVSKQVISATFVSDKEGTYTITLNGQIADTEMVNNKHKQTCTDIVIIKVAKKEESTQLSSNANLSNLGINPYDFSGFKSDKTEYDVTVPKEVEEIEIYAKSPKNINGQTITGTGSKKINIGKNTFEVKVTAEDKKTTKTYIINITRESISKVATLKNLGITPNDFTNFKFNVYSYDVEVPYEIENINIYATKKYDEQIVEGTGNKKLEIGNNNVFEIKVVAEDGKTTKTYSLNITRKNEVEPEENEAQNNEDQNPDIENGEDSIENIEIIGLTNIVIDGETLKPLFDNNIYEYNIETIGIKDSLKIKTETSSNKATVEIKGNENLKYGENIITLNVIDENNEKKVYKLIVQIKPEPVDINSVNSVIDSAHKNEQKKQLLFLMLAIILFVLIIAFFITKKIINMNNYFEDEEDDDDEKETQNNGINENQLNVYNDGINKDELNAHNDGINKNELYTHNDSINKNQLNAYNDGINKDVINTQYNSINENELNTIDNVNIINENESIHKNYDEEINENKRKRASLDYNDMFEKRKPFIKLSGKGKRYK